MNGDGICTETLFCSIENEKHNVGGGGVGFGFKDKLATPSVHGLYFI